MDDSSKDVCVVTTGDFVERDQHVTPSSRRRKSDRDLAIGYLLNLQSDQSRKTMQSALNRAANALNAGSTWETTRWSELKREDVQLLMFKLSQAGLAPATRSTTLAAVKGVLREANFARMINTDEYVAIKEIKSPGGKRIRKGRVFRNSEINDMLKSPQTEQTSVMRARNRAIFALLLGCGLRKSEACNLLTRNVFMDSKTLYIITKGDKEREIVIHSSIEDYLTDWIAAKGEPTEYFFNPVNKHGQTLERRLSASGMDYLLQQASKVAGIEPFAAHDTRRTYATRLFAAGVSPIKVRDAMGHSSIETTQLYNVMDSSELRAAIESVDLIGSRSAND